eukprot:CAMPEP_0202729332 /NCGR_PEP_ID=MMETSP1385-20130828/186078_1 /ASSEMBLY_ACC=CAM_ASM_000861 /TAXON_ID=933848 /ORGANISM="Elphidium margaritaceum" /LENGTH=85 /DNA_ID=CAMNT_0049395591 /DNA_START=179 /DNA_END=436 /DNA_ORIENTATION=+
MVGVFTAGVGVIETPLEVLLLLLVLVLELVVAAVVDVVVVLVLLLPLPLPVQVTVASCALPNMEGQLSTVDCPDDNDCQPASERP